MEKVSFCISVTDFRGVCVEFANVEKMIGSSQGENYLALKGMMLSAVRRRSRNRHENCYSWLAISL